MGGSEFSANLHEQVGVPRPLVAGLVERTTGRNVDDLRPVVRGVGAENDVYWAKLADASTVYARISPPGAGRMDREAAAMEQARAAGAPVPEVLGVDVVDAGAGDQPAMVVAEVAGRQLSDVLASLSPTQRRAVMTDLGRVLARVHSVRMPGVWRPNADGVWPEPAALRRKIAANRTAERANMEAWGLTAYDADVVVALLGASPHTPAPADPVLCHGDISAEHVFVADDFGVSGLIDWGLWHGSSAIEDLADAAMRNEWDDFTAIVDGHDIGDFDDPRFRATISLAIVNHSIGTIARHQTQGRRPPTGHCRLSGPRAARKRPAVALSAPREGTPQFGCAPDSELFYSSAKTRRKGAYDGERIHVHAKHLLCKGHEMPCVRST